MNKGIVCEYGINDMVGFYSESDYNKRVYHVWASMLQRIYSEKLHERCPMYINTTLQLELHWLSYFAEHITEIDGFDYDKFMNGELQLDKDIKSNGTNKEYSLENCSFVSQSENVRQATKTRDYNDSEYKRKKSEGLKGKNLGSLIDRYTLDMKPVDTKYQYEFVTMGFNAGHIYSCCTGKRKQHKGYIFKYHKKD